MSSHDVFVSHSNKDSDVAKAACHILENDGIRCWVAPRDISPGETWSGAIIDAITNARAMLLIYSESSNLSKQVLREVERAVAKDVPIIPFRISDTPMSKDMEYFLSTPHWLDALDGPTERHLEEMKGTVQRLLTAAETTVSRPSKTPTASAATLGTSAPAQGELTADDGSTSRKKSSWPLIGSGVVILLLVTMVLFVLFSRNPNYSDTRYGSVTLQVGESRQVRYHRSFNREPQVEAQFEYFTSPLGFKIVSDNGDSVNEEKPDLSQPPLIRISNESTDGFTIELEQNASNGAGISQSVHWQAKGPITRWTNPLTKIF